MLKTSVPFNLPQKQQEQALALRRYILVFAAVIIVTGFTLVGLSFYRGATNLMVLSVGGLCVVLGLFGVYSSVTLRLGITKIYVVAIFVILVICIVLLGLELNLLNRWVNAVCASKGFDAFICAQYRHFRWILAVVCFVVSIPACCSCMFCAYSFQIVLQPPRGRHYDHIPIPQSDDAPGNVSSSDIGRDL